MDRIAALPEGDPRRAHLAHCPRCRALLASYLGFVSAPDPVGAEMEDAERRLTAFVQDRIGPAHPRLAPATAPRRGGVWSWATGVTAPIFRRRLVRWALAGGLAAAVLVGLSLDRITHPSSPTSQVAGDRPIRQRGVDIPGGERVAPAESRLLDDGSIALSWTEVAGAEAYRIDLYDGDLQVVGSIDAGSARSIVLRGGGASDPAKGAEPLFWKLCAMRAGDEVGGSRLLPLPTRR